MGRDESVTLAVAWSSSPANGALVEFASAVDALGAAIEFQLAMAEANRDRPADTALAFWMGLHAGDLIVDGTTFMGRANIAARLEPEAPPGGSHALPRRYFPKNA